MYCPDKFHISLQSWHPYLKYPVLCNKFIICLSNISPTLVEKWKGKGKWAAGLEALLQKAQVSPVLEKAAAVVLWGGMRRQNCAIGSAAKTSKTLRHKSHFRSLKSGSSKTDLGSRRKRCQKCAKYFQMWREFFNLSNFTKYIWTQYQGRRSGVR